MSVGVRGFSVRESDCGKNFPLSTFHLQKKPQTPNPRPRSPMPVPPEDLETAKRIARAYGAARLILFGSAQEDPAAARDLDLAVDGIEGWEVWRFAGDLAERVAVPLDVVPLQLSNAFTRRIEKRGQVLYEC